MHSSTILLVLMLMPIALLAAPAASSSDPSSASPSSNTTTILPSQFFGDWSVSETINESSYRQSTKSWWNQVLPFFNPVADVYIKRAEKPDEFHIKCSYLGTHWREYKNVKLGEPASSNDLGNTAVFSFENGILYKETFDKYGQKLSLYPRYEMELDNSGKLITRTHFSDTDRRPSIFSVVYLRKSKD